MCCGEIVTTLAVFINYLLPTAMAMLSNKWKASYDTIVNTEANGKKHLCGSRKLLMDRRQLILNCATEKFYEELAISHIMKNQRNTS
jgi:hypothetical protein